MMSHTSFPKGNILKVKFRLIVPLPSPTLFSFPLPRENSQASKKTMTCDLKTTYLWASSETLNPSSWLPASGGAHCHSCCSAPEAGEPKRSRGNTSGKVNWSSSGTPGRGHTPGFNLLSKGKEPRWLVFSSNSWCQVVKASHPLSLSRNSTADSASTARPPMATIPKEKMDGERHCPQPRESDRKLLMQKVQRAGARTGCMHTMQNRRDQPSVPRCSSFSLHLAMLKPSKIHWL